MHSDLTWRLRRLRRDARKISSEERFVDYGIRLYTVRQDPGGAEISPGRPRLVSTRVEDFGGVWDCRRDEWAGESENPIVWYLSEEQRRLAVHGDDLPLKVWCEGAEGAGKTTGVLAPWFILRALEHAGEDVEIGGTSPIQPRLEALRQAIVERMAPEWYTYRAKFWLFRLRLRVRFRLLSTHVRSAAEGSPVQTYDWIACGSDEGQDQFHVFDDIETRGRRAPGGRYKRMMTVSVKESAKYRVMRKRWKATPLCGIARLPARQNPGVALEHWDNLRHTLDSRAYRRRVDALPVGPERATYPDFSVESHLIPIPRVAREVTHHVAAVYDSYQRPGAAFRLICGHDPGKVQNTTILHRVFLFPGRLLVWIVVGEFITKRTTQERHARELRAYLQEHFGCEHSPDRFDPDIGLEKALVFRDPHSRGEQRPDEDVEAAFRRHGFDIFTAAPEKQQIKRRTRIEMLCRLIKSDSGLIRFYIACNDRREPLAQETLTSFQDQERDELENPETQRKGETDITHAAVASGYALYPFEREDVHAWTYERVMLAEGVR